MNEAYLPAIAALKEKIAAREAELLAELLPLKSTANQLCKLAGEPEAYDLQASETSQRKSLRFREDQFFKQPLASSVVEIMEARDEIGWQRPVSVDEIYEHLVAGGFKFEGVTGSDENNKRALKIALTKNTAQFAKVGEKFSLKRWYRMRAPRKTTASEEAQKEISGPATTFPREDLEFEVSSDQVPDSSTGESLSSA